MRTERRGWQHLCVTRGGGGGGAGWSPGAQNAGEESSLDELGLRHPRENQSNSRCQLVPTGPTLPCILQRHSPAPSGAVTPWFQVTTEAGDGSWQSCSVNAGSEAGLPRSARTPPLCRAAQVQPAAPRSLSCSADFSVAELQTAPELTGAPGGFLHVRSPGDPGTRRSASPQVAQIKWLHWGN